jgi:5-methylcytosine-specific restriction endonuclease McrA
MRRHGRRRPSRDHIMPKSGGHTLAPPNRLIVCGRCNEDKGRCSLAAFLAALEAEGDPRSEHVAAVLQTIYCG